MGEIHRVVWQKSVAKQLERIPSPITRKFFAWVSAVRLAGLGHIRLLPGFHVTNHCGEITPDNVLSGSEQRIPGDL